MIQIQPATIVVTSALNIIKLNKLCLSFPTALQTAMWKFLVKRDLHANSQRIRTLSRYCEARKVGRVLT